MASAGVTTILPYLLHDQYQGYLSGGADQSYTVERRDELDDLARASLDDLEGIEDVQPELLDHVREVAGGRHLMMWSADPTVQSGVEAAGAGRPDRS